MKIWVDADAAPQAVKDVVYPAALRLEIQAVLVANRRLSVPLNNPHVTAVWVQGGPDVGGSLHRGARDGRRHRDHRGHPARSGVSGRHRVRDGPGPSLPAWLLLPFAPVFLRQRTSGG